MNAAKADVSDETSQLRSMLNQDEDLRNGKKQLLTIGYGGLF